MKQQTKRILLLTSQRNFVDFALAGALHEVVSVNAPDGHRWGVWSDPIWVYHPEEKSTEIRWLGNQEQLIAVCIVFSQTVRKKKVGLEYLEAVVGRIREVHGNIPIMLLGLNIDDDALITQAGIMTGNPGFPNVEVLHHWVENRPFAYLYRKFLDKLRGAVSIH